MNANSERVLSDKTELENLAIELIAFAKDFKIWAFYGEMGAGKTTFIREICKIFGVKENVSSPTFSLINEYSDLKGNSIFHFDFFALIMRKKR